MKIETPGLQIALDMIQWEHFSRVVDMIPKNRRIIIEAGTPLLKRFGTDAIAFIRKSRPYSFILADMKTLDVGQLEVEIAWRAGADGASVSGLAPETTINSFIQACQEKSILSFMDTLGVTDPCNRLSSLDMLPDVVLLHRGIDEECNSQHNFSIIGGIKSMFPDVIVAIAGGLGETAIKEAVRNGADIVVVGRYITTAENPETRIGEILNMLEEDP